PREPGRGAGDAEAGRRGRGQLPQGGDRRHPRSEGRRLLDPPLSRGVRARPRSGRTAGGGARAVSLDATPRRAPRGAGAGSAPAVRHLRLPLPEREHLVGGPGEALFHAAPAGGRPEPGGRLPARAVDEPGDASSAPRPRFGAGAPQLPEVLRDPERQRAHGQPDRRLPAVRGDALRLEEAPVEPLRDWNLNPFIHPLQAARGYAGHLVDLEGRDLIDFSSAWGANILGYGYPRVAEAMAAQARSFAGGGMATPG